MGSPTGWGGILVGGIEGIGKEGEKERMGSPGFSVLPFSVSLTLLSRPDLFIPRFLAPHALGVSIASPCSCGNAAGSSLRSRIDRLSEEAVVTITRVLCILFPVCLSFSPSWHARFRSRVSTR